MKQLFYHSDYEKYFSEESIIKCICQIRISRARSIHEQAFLRKIFKQGPQKSKSSLSLMLPPRKDWRRFRPRKSARQKCSNSTLLSLERCISRNRHQTTPLPPWLNRLNSFISQLRSAVLGGCFRFSTPIISPQIKSGNDYRAIASFPDLESKIVDIINSKYLRENLDEVFESSSIAFRNSSKINRDSAIDRIFKIRDKSGSDVLYVTECDIRGFFDCVHHPVAKNSLNRAISLLSVRAPERHIDQRSIDLFKRYLDCYSFSKTVIPETGKLREREKKEAAIYKWPSLNEEEAKPNNLKYYHKSPRNSKIGVPQGGAHSCLIANLILDLADKEVLLKLHEADNPGLYLRYCDDIIIISSSESNCRAASNVYKKCLEYLKLPYHLPSTMLAGAHFYNSSKTKECYKWGARRSLSEYPWIQFLGYQIKHDGEIRIRRSSIQKQKDKITNLRLTLFKELKEKPSKVSPKRILYRFNSKVWAFTSGRIDPSKIQVKPLPMCWASGFRQLSKRKFRHSTIKSLDQVAGANRRWLERSLKKINTGKKSKTPIKRALKYFGSPFSHLKQFK